MFTKAVFIGFPDNEVPSGVMERLGKLVSAHQLISNSDPNLKATIADAEVIFCRISTTVDKEVIDAAPNLKYIGVLATSFDKIDIEYAKEKGIAVCNLGGYSTEAVAEFTFAVLFEQIRELERAKNQARAGDYSFDKFMCSELKDKTLGVLGAGRIGGRIAEIGLGIGMKVIYFNRSDKPNLDARGAQKKGLDEVLSESDVISVNLALNDQTNRILSREKINLINNGGILINTASTKLIDMEALVDRAEKGEITGIFDHVDLMDPDSASVLLKTPNIIVYPPIAFRTKEADEARWETFISNLEMFSQGHPQNVVNQ